MLEFSLTHEFACSPQRFWQLFFDPEFTREMIVGGLGFATCDVEPVTEQDGKRRRSMRVIPKLDLPGPVAKLLGPKLGYTEHGRFDVATQEWSYEIVMSVLSDRIRLGGRLRVEPGATPAQCRRISALWCDIRILGLGGLVERAAEKNMRDGWEKSAVWFRGWLTAHPGDADASTGV